jgi:hypothetical protein
MHSLRLTIPPPVIRRSNIVTNRRVDNGNEKRLRTENRPNSGTLIGEIFRDSEKSRRPADHTVRDQPAANSIEHKRRLRELE